LVNDSGVVNRQRSEGVEQPVHLAPDGSRTVTEPTAADHAERLPDERAAVFRDLVGAALDRAYSRATVLLADRFEAEDAVHDAAERAWRGWGSLRDTGRFEPWFDRILVNVCRDRLRKRRRIAEIEVDAAEQVVVDGRAGEHIARAADRDVLIEGLEALSVDERIAIALRFEADLTVPAIARLTGAREGTIKSRLHTALRKLRTHIAAMDIDR
jgi:RNA polymerase sigma-70 factor, ECF subfamily